MNPEQERKLVKEAGRNPEAFGILYDFYFPKIFGYAFRRTGNFDLAHDITSETFLKAYLNLAKFTFRQNSMAPWLYRIATNEINGWYRKKKYHPSSLDIIPENQILEIADPDSLEAEKNAAEKILQQHEDFLLIQQKLKHIPVKYQEVITLRYFEQMSVKEICLILQKKEGTVKSLISRGLERLRKLL